MHIYTLIAMGCGSSKDGAGHGGGGAVGDASTSTNKPTTKERKESVFRPAPTINVTYGANVQMVQPPNTKVIFVFGMHICILYVIYHYCTQMMSVCSYLIHTCKHCRWSRVWERSCGWLSTINVWYEACFIRSYHSQIPAKESGTCNGCHLYRCKQLLVFCNIQAKFTRNYFSVCDACKYC